MTSSKRWGSILLNSWPWSKSFLNGILHNFSSRLSFMRIILDFDHTLFDMQRMHQELIGALERISIPEKMYKEAYSLETHWKVFTVQGFANRLASKSGIAQEIIEKTLWDVAKSSGHCLYPDVMEVCKELKSAGHTLILLSWGD